MLLYGNTSRRMLQPPCHLDGTPTLFVMSQRAHAFWWVTRITCRFWLTVPDGGGGDRFSLWTSSCLCFFHVCALTPGCLQAHKRSDRTLTLSNNFSVMKCTCLFIYLFLYFASLGGWGGGTRFVRHLHAYGLVTVPWCCENNPLLLADGVATSEFFTLIERTHRLCSLSCGAACNTLAWWAVCHPTGLWPSAGVQKVQMMVHFSILSNWRTSFIIIFIFISIFNVESAYGLNLPIGCFSVERC